MDSRHIMIVVYCAAIFVLLIFSAFFSLADTSYSTVNRLRLEKAKKKGSRTAALAFDYAVNYDSTIATILFGNNLVNILATSISTLLAKEIFEINGFMGNVESAEAVMSVYFLLILITFGEIIPKTIGHIYSFHFSLSSVPFLKFFEIVFFPIVWLTTWIAKFLTAPILKRGQDSDEAPSDEELQEMVKQIENEGIIDQSQSELLHRSIKFKETSAHEIMTPRVAIVGVEYDANLIDWAKKPGVLSHSRIIVYKKNYDHIVGYIPTKALLKVILKKSVLSADSLMMPILTVPKTMEISSVLRLMKQSHHHIAVVKDEYGGTDGILTLEDILEELVGELYDESEAVRQDVSPTSRKNVFLVLGKMDIEDFFAQFNLNNDFIEDDYNTLSGWINDKLGRFAQVGDVLTYGTVALKVTKASEYTVKEVEVTYHPRKRPRHA